MNNMLKKPNINLGLFCLTNNNKKPKNIDYDYILLNSNDIKNDLTPLGFCYAEGYHMYHIWKNKLYKNYTHIGFFQYRKIWPNDFLNYVEKNNIIVSNTVFYNISIYQQWINIFNKEDLILCLSIIEKFYPDMLQISQDCINTSLFVTSNMFIVPIDIFEKYCEFVFGILEKFNIYKGFKTYSDVESYISNNISKYPECNKTKDIRYSARLHGHLLERLTSIFMYKYNDLVLRLPIKICDYNYYD